MIAFKDRFNTWLPLFWILCGALILRLYGITFGLPHLYAWDEPFVVLRAIRLAGGDLNPHLIYPALYLYLLFIANGLYFAFAFVIGVYNSTAQFAADFFLDPSAVFLVSRATTAAFGTGCVYLTYLLGQKMFDRSTGLLAALFLSVSVLHVTYSHIAVTDIPHTFFILLAVNAAWRVATRGSVMDYVWCGIAMGLGAATKYLASFAVVSLLCAHVLRPRRSLRRLLFSAVSFAVTFVVATPFTFLDFGSAITDLKTLGPLANDVAELSPTHSTIAVVFHVIPGDIGWPLFIASAVGFIIAARKHRRIGIVLMSFPLVYYLLLAISNQSSYRYCIPLTPFACVLAGVAVVEGWHRMGVSFPRATRVLAPALVVVLLAEPFYCAAWWDFVITHCVDSRTLALCWAEENIPSGSSVSIQTLASHTVDNIPLFTDYQLSRIEGNFPASERFREAKDFVMSELRKRPTYHLIEFSYDAQRLRAMGVEYVFMTDAFYDKERILHEGSFLEELKSQAILVREFKSDLPGEKLVPPYVARPVFPPKISVYRMVAYKHQ